MGFLVLSQDQNCNASSYLKYSGKSTLCTTLKVPSFEHNSLLHALEVTVVLN